MATKARHFTDKMKLGDAMELTDSCFELFAKDPSLCQGDITPLQRFTRVTKNILKTSPLGQVVTLVLSSVPHSMAVERTVSHYNIIRSDKRLSMSLQSTNDRLLIALNGPGTADFDPRPAVAAFFRKKERRHREPELQLYRSRPFVQKFFRDKATIKINYLIQGELHVQKYFLVERGQKF